MKLIKKLFPLAFLGFVTYTCERDDICAETTPTTPRLLVEFYDIANQDEIKFVPRLTVYGEGLDESTSSILSSANETEVALPLLVGTEGEVTITRYNMVRFATTSDGEPNPDANTDIIEIIYTPQFEYVSRACGYKSVFTNLRVNIIADGDNWALGTVFPDSNTDNINVENENSTHVNILH